MSTEQGSVDAIQRRKGKRKKTTNKRGMHRVLRVWSSKDITVSLANAQLEVVLLDGIEPLTSGLGGAVIGVRIGERSDLLWQKILRSFALVFQ
jgi:hypothetical protein